VCSFRSGVSLFSPVANDSEGHYKTSLKCKAARPATTSKTVQKPIGEAEEVEVEQRRGREENVVKKERKQMSERHRTAQNAPTATAPRPASPATAPANAFLLAVPVALAEGAAPDVPLAVREAADEPEAAAEERAEDAEEGRGVEEAPAAVEAEECEEEGGENGQTLRK
jgi:hypothetical protein